MHMYIYVNVHMLANRLSNSWPPLRVAGWQPSVLKGGGKFCCILIPDWTLRTLTTIHISSIG